MPNTLTIIGLGPGDPDLRTIAAQRALDVADRIILRTGDHPGVDDLFTDARVSTCDDLYQQMPTFQALYKAVVERLISELEMSDLVYAVPGNPVAGELTVIAAQSAAIAAGHEVIVIPGTGGLDVIAATTGLDLMADGVQTLDALDIRDWLERSPFNGSLLDISPVRPLIVTQVYKRSIATTVKKALSTIYPDAHEVSVVGWDSAAGVNSAQLIPLHRLDQVHVDHLTSVVVPPLDWKANTRSPQELFRIVARLRDENGCPWDREQTHESIRGAVIEEAFEVVDAIDSRNMTDLAEELGDLLIQVALHAQMATEADQFDAADVFDAISSKLIRRHPHVFGDVVANDPDAVIQTWNQVKQAEPGKENRGRREPIDELPVSMPVTLKIAGVETPDGSTLTDDQIDQIASGIAVNLRTLARAGVPLDRAIEAAYRILVR